jgi:hypothetical protein
MIPKRHLIIVPGLGNEEGTHLWAAKRWQKYGIEPHVLNLKWKTKEDGFDKKLTQIVDLVDQLSKNGGKVSLLGTSAGGSAVLNAYYKRKNETNKVITLCSRLRTGNGIFYSFDRATSKSPSFRESVLRTEGLEPKLTKEDRKKILTIHPLFDELVPESVSTIPGATNILIPSVEHVLSGALAMTIFSRKIVNFLLE